MGQRIKVNSLLDVITLDIGGTIYNDTVTNVCAASAGEYDCLDDAPTGWAQIYRVTSNVPFSITYNNSIVDSETVEFSEGRPPIIVK